MTNRHPRSLRLGITLAIAAGLLFAAGAVQAQINPARINGTVTLEDGTPLTGVKVRFAPGAGSARAARSLKVNKKGKFSHGFFPAGSYVLELEGEEFFLKHIKYEAKEPSGTPMDALESDAHPEKGLPPIRVPGNSRVTIELIAADAATKKKMVQQVAIAEASGELTKVSEAFMAGDLDTVLVETEKLLAEKPELGPALYARGVALHRTERVEEAVDVLAQAVVHASDQPGVHGVYAMALLDLAKKQSEMGHSGAKENFSLAADEFAMELAETPGNLAVITNQVVALERSGREDESIDALEALVQADPQNINAYFRLASLHRKMGNMEKALEILASVPSAGDDAAKAIYNMCVNLYNENEYDTTIMALNKAIEIDPNLALAYNLKGFALVAKGLSAEAVPAFEKFVELAPDHPQAAQARDMIAAFKK